MPKRNDVRPIAGRGEVNLARRIEKLRTAHGMSYETLAKAMTEVGCSITKAAVYSIERGTPPRRITVDELMAFAEVFDLPVSDLLDPVELVDKRRARELVESIQRNQRDVGEWSMNSFNSFVELLELARTDQELYEYVVNHLESGDKGSYTLSVGGEDDNAVADLALLRMVKANSDYWRELQKVARMWSAYTNGHWGADDDRRVEERLVEVRAALDTHKGLRTEETD